MSQRNKKRRGAASKRLSTLLLWVIAVFVILLVSIILAGVIAYLLERFGLMPAFADNTLLALLSFILLVSLGIGTFLAVGLGYLFLQPLRRLIEANKRVASGDFSVRMEPRGTDEIKRLMDSFNDMVQDLGSIETLRNDFVANISHEFKTPVVSIRGFARLLKKGKLSEQQQTEYLDIIILESQRLSLLSSNVLLLSRLDSTARITDAASYHLDEQLRRAILLMEPQITAKRITLNVNLQPAQIVASEELLQEVWLNLLQNALKFTPEGGSIAVRLYLDGKMLVVEVSDTGIGMEPEVQAHVFDKFYQGDKSHKVQGNGLGLALVKRILDLNNATIQVQSEVGSGSTFILRFPTHTA